MGWQGLLLLCHGVNFAGLSVAVALLVGWPRTAFEYILAPHNGTGHNGGGNCSGIPSRQGESIASECEASVEAVLLGAVLAAAAVGPIISAVAVLRPKAVTEGAGAGGEALVAGVMQPAVLWFALLVATLYLQTSLSMEGL